MFTVIDVKDLELVTSAGSARSNLPESRMKATDGLSRGARECLKRLHWYQRRYGRVHPNQKTLAKGLRVSDRQLRTYLAELRRAGFISVRQGGDGRTASYAVTSGLTSDLTSGLLPGCILVAREDESRNQNVAMGNFRAERTQSRSICSLGSDQSECVGIEPAPRLIPVSDDYRNAQRQAVKRAVEVTGIAPTTQLIEKLARKAQFYDVTGFVIAAHITRAWNRIAAQPSNHPRKPAWILRAVEEELVSDGKRESGGPRPHANLPIEEAPTNAVLDNLIAAATLSFRPPASPKIASGVAPSPRCMECYRTGVRQSPADPELSDWCACGDGARRRAESPDAVDRGNRAVLKLRLLRESAALYTPFKPLSFGRGYKRGEDEPSRPHGSDSIDRKGLVRARDVVPILPLRKA